MASEDVLPESFKLEGIRNYQSWQGRMRFLLRKEGTWGYIDPAVDNPPIDGEPDYVVAARVRGLYSICMSCKDGPCSIITACSDPREAWNLLAATYKSAPMLPAAPTNVAQRLLLKAKLHSLRVHKTGSVQEYLCQIEDIQSELRSIEAEMSETSLVELMIITLPPSFDFVYQDILGLNEIPTFADMSARLLHAEARGKFRAVFGRRPHQQSYRKLGPCTFCGDAEHHIRRCPDLAREIAKRARDRRTRSATTFQANLAMD